MDLFIDQLISSVVTIFVMLLLPFFWWFVTARKNRISFRGLG